MAEKRGRPTMEVGRKMNRVTIRLSNEELRRLEALAKCYGSTKSEAARHILRCCFGIIERLIPLK